MFAILTSAYVALTVPITSICCYISEHATTGCQYGRCNSSVLVEQTTRSAQDNVCEQRSLQRVCGTWTETGVAISTHRGIDRLSRIEAIDPVLVAAIDFPSGAIKGEGDLIDFLEVRTAPCNVSV